MKNLITLVDLETSYKEQSAQMKAEYDRKKLETQKEAEAQIQDFTHKLAHKEAIIEEKVKQASQTIQSTKPNPHHIDKDSAKTIILELLS